MGKVMSNIIETDEISAISFGQLCPGDCFIYAKLDRYPEVFMKLAVSPPKAVKLVDGGLHSFSTNELCALKKRVVIKRGS